MDTYRESFLDICNDQGQAPVWAIRQIFEEHGSDLHEFSECTPAELCDNGETILEWIGY
tara:strand:+ start:116 stop:292 length:177 start_codon:yes stop_codon:yes gene_type:complete